ncbi:hypothetical protein BH11CYA1_BH11CYA1_05450 [soil metagenome]
MNKKRTITLVAAVVTIALGSAIGESVSTDPYFVAVAGSFINQLLGEDTEGQQVIPLQTQHLRHYGFINSSGMCVIPPAFEKTSSFSEGLCAVQVKKKWGFVNKRGEMVVPPRFSKVKDFSEGLAAVKEGVVWGYIDRVGNYLVKPTRWREVTSFKNGIAIINDGLKKGIIYRSGEYICRDLDSVDPLSDGYYCIKRGDRYGFIRQDGRSFVEPKFEDAADFSEGLAGVSQGKKWGYIDTSYKMVIAPQFASVGGFHKGLAVASEGGKYGIIDRSGAFRLKPIYRYLSAIPPIDTSVISNKGTSSSSSLRNTNSATENSASSTNSQSTDSGVKSLPVAYSPGMGVTTILVDGVAYSSSASRTGASKAGKSNKTASTAAPTLHSVIPSDGAELTPIVVNQFWGYADANGIMAIPAQYADVRLFSEGLAAVSMFDQPALVAKCTKAREAEAKMRGEEAEEKELEGE